VHNGADPDAIWPRVSEVISERTGLHFPPERWRDLERGLEAAARELDCANAQECAQLLLSTSWDQARLQTVARHLTVGETYFFRDRKMFETLAERALRPLLQSRRGERRLRLWSAACCTGEEAYTLAILLDTLGLPADWNITILATDINDQFLKKAESAIYGEWSFRETPAHFKRYFQRTAEGRYIVAPEIKERVTFSPLNLVDDSYPSLTTNTNAMDVILCRNVLMYFSPAQARRVVEKLRNCLALDGWLATSPMDGLPAAAADLQSLTLDGSIFHRRREAVGMAPVRPIHPVAAFQVEPPVFVKPAWEPPVILPEVAPPAAPKLDTTAAESLYAEGRHAEAARVVLESLENGAIPDAAACSLLARACANQGRLAEAQQWCGRWLKMDKLNASGHYLAAVVAEEMGDEESARRSLCQALYLDPDFALAQFALGNLARRDGNHKEAKRCFGLALRLLRARQPDEVLAESEGMTAGRLQEMVASLMRVEDAA
jgi:chemotaxis protein methyltransferase CheR